jgi:hypothetical protein
MNTKYNKMSRMQLKLHIEDNYSKNSYKEKKLWKQWSIPSLKKLEKEEQIKVKKKKY